MRLGPACHADGTGEPPVSLAQQRLDGRPDLQREWHGAPLPASVVDIVSVAVTFGLSGSDATMSTRFSGVSSVYVPAVDKFVAVGASFAGVPVMFFVPVADRVPSLTLVAIGLVIGIGLALISGSVIETLLFGVPVNDVLTYGAVAAGFLAVALLACAVPARRAASVDPMIALRSN